MSAKSSANPFSNSDPKRYSWTLFFSDGTKLLATGPIWSSAWYLYWSNGHLEDHGRKFFDTLTSVCLNGEYKDR